ncbi:MAG: lyase domain protein repeat-containing protein [Gemmataceae bacterium]|nr:lyase domain protein repeat-containing protein [Gemmataceae bacterium]
MRKVLGVGGGLLVAAVALGFLVPAVRYKLSGRLAGEPVVEGQPVGYWLYVIGEGGTKEERAGAARALGHLGRGAPPGVAPALARALADPGPEVRRNAALALGQVGAEAAPLLAALADPDGEVRAAAASSLGELRPADPAAIPGLQKAAAGDPDVLARLAAIAALGRYGDQAAVPVLVDVLKENDTNLGSPHEFAVAALKEVGPQSLPAVTRALGRAEPRARIGALKVLTRFGAAARPAIPEVEGRLADEDPLVRLEAVQCLWAIERSPGRATRAALAHLRAPEANPRKRLQTRAKALYILGEVGPEAKPAVPDLLTILKDDPESAIRMYSAQALGKMGPDPAIREALTAAAKNDKDPDVCRAANEALKTAGRL